MEGRFVMMRDFGGWDMSGGGCRACEVWNMWVQIDNCKLVALDIYAWQKIV